MSTKHLSAYVGEVVLTRDEDFVVGFQYLSNNQIVKWTRTESFKLNKDIFSCAKEFEETLRVECKKHELESMFFEFGLEREITERDSFKEVLAYEENF